MGGRFDEAVEASWGRSEQQLVDRLRGSGPGSAGTGSADRDLPARRTQRSCCQALSEAAAAAA